MLSAVRHQRGAAARKPAKKAVAKIEIEVDQPRAKRGRPRKSSRKSSCDAEPHRAPRGRSSKKSSARSASSRSRSRSRSRDGLQEELHRAESEIHDLKLRLKGGKAPKKRASRAHVSAKSPARVHAGIEAAKHRERGPDGRFLPN